MKSTLYHERIKRRRRESATLWVDMAVGVFGTDGDGDEEAEKVRQGFCQ